MMNTGILQSKMNRGKTLSMATASVQASTASITIPGNLEYFGYFHTEHGRQNEVAGHTNLSVFDWSDYNQLARDLAIVKDKGNKAVITTSFLYTPSAEGGFYTLDQFAETRLLGFMNRLVGDGFFDPNNPKNGTVIGFYPVDEPEIHGLADVNGAPAPMLAQIVNLFKSNANARLAPLATCASKYYTNSVAGLKLFDWIGIDSYDDDDDAYVGKFDHLQSLLQLRPEQRMFLVPQAAIFRSANSPANDDAECHDPYRMLFVAQTNPCVIAIVPFMWNTVSDGAGSIYGLGSGLPELQDVRQAYDQIGKQVKFARANAQWIGQMIPNTMVAGSYYDVRVDMKNTGNVVWELGEVFLGTQNPHDNTIWGAGRVWLPSRIRPGETAVMVFPVRAPTTPGVYNLQGRMVAETITWFGDLTPNVAVNVVAG